MLSLPLLSLGFASSLIGELNPCIGGTPVQVDGKTYGTKLLIEEAGSGVAVTTPEQNLSAITKGVLMKEQVSACALTVPCFDRNNLV